MITMKFLPVVGTFHSCDTMSPTTTATSSFSIRHQSHWMFGDAPGSGAVRLCCGLLLPAWYFCIHSTRNYFCTKHIIVIIHRPNYGGRAPAARRPSKHQQCSAAAAVERANPSRLYSLDSNIYIAETMTGC